MSEEKKPVGYMVSLIMDYGSGRQIQISGNLPLNASREDFDAELDKLREATNRQQAFVIMREAEAKLRMEQKMVSALKLMVESYDTELEKEMARIKEESAAHSTGKQRSVVTQQIENMRAQAASFRSGKTQELQQHEANVGIHEVTIASIKKELGITTES